MDPLQRHNARLTGTGSRTLVLANGFCTTQTSWDSIVAAVPGGWRVLRFEYVGNPDTPESAWDAARYSTLHGHADDVRALLEALDVRDAVFVGHSMSGMIGALVAIAAPERIARLITLGSSPRYSDVPGEYRGGFSQEEIDASLALADADLEAWMAGFAPAMLGSEAAPHLIQEYAGHILHMRPDVTRTMLRSIFDSDYREILPHIGCPTTVLQAARDAGTPPSVGRYLASRIPRATLVTLDVTGHLPHLTAPDVVAGALGDTLAQADMSGVAR